MGRKKTLGDITQYIIKSQSRVSFANKNSTLDSYSLDDITDAYLRAYRLKKHNILEQGYDIGLPGMLCYDLMLCANPYADLLKQYFFTLFSLETVAKEKDFWAKIYTYYLNNDPFVCIDTILQICYATPDVITDPNILKRITNYGLCLQLNSNPSPDNDLFYIQPDADSLVIVKKVLESNQVSIINRKMCEFQHAENQQLIVECVDLLDEAVAAATSNVDLPENDSVSYTEMIDAFLRNKHTSIQEYCNYIRILVINILSVPEMQYLYFISVTSRDNLQIGHYTYSSKIATSISNLKKLTVLSYAFIASVVETNLAAIYFRRIEEQKKQIQKESLKSAVSAIMTRNMSHNLGSHYLHYTKTQLEQLAKRGGEFGPDIRGAAKVMEYMQGRMDYLATLVSGDRFPYGCVNFKSQIYDVLTIDDFSKRHFKNGKRVSNEQLSPIMEIVAEIQKNNSKKNVREKIPDLYSKSRDALQKDGYSRTTNFLLSNLILSEGFTRSHILNDNEKIENSINLHVLFDNQIFTGAPIAFDDTILNEIIKKEEENGLSQEEAERKKELETQKSDKEKQRIAEEKAKQAISNINIAMPGGVMSCHAFFNIIENFIRNSAKYLQSDFSENKDLTITIKIAEKLVDHKQDKENLDDANGEKVDVYEFTIFDNKHNANKKQPDTNKSLLDNLVDKISNLRILDDNNVLDKKDKGFKEMLFSALWLRSYVYQNADGKNNPNSYEDVLVQIQSIKEPSVKLKQIKQYGFSFLAVDNDGQENDTEKANLALRFTLPKFNKTTKLELANDENIDLGNLLHIYADIASVDDGFTDFVKQLNKERADKEKDSYGEDMIIPRMLRKADSKITDVKALQTVLYTRFGEEFDNYKISSDDNNTSELGEQYNIYFKRHLSTQCKTMENYKNYAYADSVSGGNYTITLFDIYNRWVKNGRDTASEDYYEILKIKESALTRITLIDERLYKKMKVQKTETELACKNIRILNYNESNFSEDKIDNFINLFMDDHKFNNGNNSTHFLSIHLGIIEKIVKNADMFTLMRNENGQPVSIDDKVKIFMRLLKEKFGSKVFVSVHSGRGNFSAELEQSLDMYPFISMAALENAFENSKYLLCQLFYSTIYIGKGVANQHNQED